MGKKGLGLLLAIFVILTIVLSLDKVGVISLGDSKQSSHNAGSEDDKKKEIEVDFAEAILGEKTQLKKLEVLSVELSEATKLNNRKKLNIFKKYQVITYNGEAVYTIDLSQLKTEDISYDETGRTVTLVIPHAVLERVVIPGDEIEFGDVQKGFLAFGDIKMNAEESAAVIEEVETRMREKVEEEDMAGEADRFAKLSVWEIFQPVVTAVSPECQLEVVFAE